MTKHYDPALTMADARTRYFADNAFGEDGGYGDAWVDFKLGPIPMPFPNTKARVRAVQYHDLHHVLTGYATDTLGELEISAWELGAGCRDFWAAWQLNLGGLAAGTLASPRRTFRAFVRGRRSTSLYGEDMTRLLASSVGALRDETRVDAPASPASPTDAALFALAFVAGFAIGLPQLAMMLVIAPVAALAALFRRRASATA